MVSRSELYIHGLFSFQIMALLIYEQVSLREHYSLSFRCLQTISFNYSSCCMILGYIVLLLIYLLLYPFIHVFNKYFRVTILVFGSAEDIRVNTVTRVGFYAGRGRGLQ